MLPHCVVWDVTTQLELSNTAEQLGSFNVMEPIPYFVTTFVGNLMETCFLLSSHSLIIDFSISSATT